MTEQKKRDKAKTFGRITFAALATVLLGTVVSIVVNSSPVFAVFFVIGVLIFGGNLLFLTDDDKPTRRY